MTQAKSTKRAAQESTSVRYGSLNEWKANFLPELARMDTYKSLRRDTEQLAQTLANDTFDRLRTKRGA